jgi:hypothetical protein
MNWRESFPGLAALTKRNWRVFLPGLAILAIAWAPIALTPILILLRHFHVEPDVTGFGFAWGLFITLPGTVVGVLVLFAGIFALIRSANNSN